MYFMFRPSNCCSMALIINDFNYCQHGSTPHISLIQLEISRLQLLKNSLRVVLLANLNQARLVRFPVPFKHPLSLGRVVLVDEFVIQAPGFGGSGASVDEAGTGG